MGTISHTKGNLVACICEGVTERIIMEMLLEEDKLIFSKQDLLDDDILSSSMRKAKVFQDTYLGLQLPAPIEIFRIVDSTNEKFYIEQFYREKIETQYNIVTKPEIEMLVIHNENKYEDFLKTKTKMKPSIFCKNNLQMRHIKNTKFIKEYFKDIDKLIQAIEIYHSKRGDKDSYSLKDLIRQ